MGSNRLAEFIGNPNDFIAMVLRCIKGELAKLLIEGIQYEKLDGSIYELRELQTLKLPEISKVVGSSLRAHRITSRKQQTPLATFQQGFHRMGGGHGMNPGIALKSEGNELRRGPVRRISHQREHDERRGDERNK